MDRKRKVEEKIVKHTETWIKLYDMPDDGLDNEML
jgi:hypothetical protein